MLVGVDENVFQYEHVDGVVVEGNESKLRSLVDDHGGEDCVARDRYRENECDLRGLIVHRGSKCYVLLGWYCFSVVVVAS